MRNLIDKIKIVLKVVDQSFTELVGRLKDQSSKIIYISNKYLRDIQTKRWKIYCRYVGYNKIHGC